MRKKIILIILALLIVFLAVLGVWQRNNIKAFINSLRYSENEISEKLENNNQKLKKIVDETEYINIRGALTEEEEKALASGEITSEDAMRLVKGDVTLEELRSSESASAPAEAQNTVPPENSVSGAPEKAPDALPQQSDGDAQPKPKTDAEIMQEEVSQIVAEMYVLKSDFVNQLEALSNQAISDYEEGGENKSQVNAIVESYLPAAGSLETACDQKMNALLARLEESLKKGGGDLGLVNEVRQFYYNEKSLKKSYYLNKIYG